MQILLADHYAPAVPINIIYSAHRLLPRRAAVFMDFIAEAFGRDPALQEGALARLSGKTPSRKAKASLIKPL